MCYICRPMSWNRAVVMSKTQTVRARVEPGLKRGAEAVLKQLGLTSSEAITLFYTQVTLTKGLPFRVGVPSKQTRRALKEARSRKNVETFDTVSHWSKKVRAL